MLLETVYIYETREATGMFKKVMEGNRRRWKHIELYGSL